MLLKSQKPRQRAGFTLIELLVVIAIIGVLAAITAGAVFRVLQSQSHSRSATLVKKVNVGFETQIRAVVDDVNEDIKNGKVPQSLISAVGDRDIAKALWLKMKMQYEFPQTFNEARSPYIANYGVPAKNFYVQELLGAGSNPSDPRESAVCLFLALSQARRGSAFNVDDAGSIKVVNVSGKDFKVFVDAWGQPITFQRWSMDPQLVADLTAMTGGKDPQDQFGKLATNFPNKSTFESNLGDSFTGQNRGPVVRSAGPNKVYSDVDDLIGFLLK